MRKPHTLGLELDTKRESVYNEEGVWISTRPKKVILGQSYEDLLADRDRQLKAAEDRVSHRDRLLRAAERLVAQLEEQVKELQGKASPAGDENVDSTNTGGSQNGNSTS